MKNAKENIIMKENDIPIGFGEALLANSAAMDRYLRLPKHKQEEILNGTASITSSKEMRAYVERIGE